MTRLAALLASLLAVLTLAPLVVALGFAAALPTAPAALPPPTAAPAEGVTPGDVGVVLGWAESQVGDRYRMGANGPDAWDCSSFTQAAYAQIGIRLPRVAQQQRDWLAAGHGQPVTPGQEQPGDLVFWDSYLGPDTIGHVVLVDNPDRRTTLEAHNTRSGVGHFTYHPDHHRYEIWRPHTGKAPS